MQVLVALSGGVDSTVAAALLAEDGHETVGVTMKLWGGDSDTGCCSVADVEDARRAAAQLGVEHHVFNFAEEFAALVVDPYVADHAAGRTPNPCIECNRHLKFDLLLRRADLLGFDAVATGHHARVVDEGGVLRVGRGLDRAKDQSYVLHHLRSADLARVRFPIGHLAKSEVRRRAVALGVRTATKPDSQDVCFITRSRGRAGFLGARAELHAGTVVDEDGNVVGSTPAVELVTVGQRRGLDLAGGTGRRFALDVDVASRTVTVGPPERLLRDRVVLAGPVWSGEPVEGPVLAQCSAHGEAAPAVVEPGPGTAVTVRWRSPRRRVAPGQSVVLYPDDPRRHEVVLGGGTAV